MKNLSLITLCILFSMSTAVAQEANVEDEKEAIKFVIQDAYVDGLCNNADRAAVNKGFHPGFNVLGVGQGETMWKNPIYNWIEYAEIGKAKGNKYAFQNEFTTIKFQFIDVSGNAAVAKINFYEGGIHKYIDYLSLLKFESGWKLVSKTFYKIPEEKDEKRE